MMRISPYKSVNFKKDEPFSRFEAVETHASMSHWRTGVACVTSASSSLPETILPQSRGYDCG